MRAFRNALASAALISFAVAQPLAAQAATARVASPVVHSDELAGKPANALVVVGVFALLLLLAEVTDLIDIFGNDDELPTSP